MNNTTSTKTAPATNVNLTPAGVGGTPMSTQASVTVPRKQRQHSTTASRKHMHI